jgi:hypothetical protein
MLSLENTEISAGGGGGGGGGLGNDKQSCNDLAFLECFFT